MLKQFVTRGGYGNSAYALLSVRKDGRTFSRKVHRLIAGAFFGTALPGVEVNHIDGNGLNNNVANLEYVSGHSANMLHAHAAGLMHLPFHRRPKDSYPRGEAHLKAILTEDNVRFIRRNPSLKAVDLAKQFGVSKSAIYNVRRANGNWQHIK